MITRTQLHRLGWHLMLALLLLLMQQVGLRHAFEHEPHEDDAAPTHAACLLCAAYHVHGAAPGTAPKALQLLGLAHVHTTPITLPQFGARVSLHYQSRAPPGSAWA